MQRRRRQTGGRIDDGFVTVCEARFVPNPENDNKSTFMLVWVCPEGVAAPPTEELDEICQILFAMGLVSFCSSPGGLLLELNTEDLPGTR